MDAKEILSRNTSLFAQVGSDFADAKLKLAPNCSLFDRMRSVFAVASGPIMERLRPARSLQTSV